MVSTRTVTWTLGAMIALAYVAVLVGGQTFADLGWLGEVGPARHAAGRAIALGQLPAWWPEAGFGVPLLAEPDHGALYPPTWLAGLGGAALDVVALAHLWLLAIGSAALAGRLGADTPGRLLAGAAVALAAVSAGALVDGTLFALAWTPLAAAQAFAVATAISDGHDRRARLRAALALAAALAAAKLAGTPIIADAAMVTAVLVGAVRAGLRGAGWCAAAAVASVLLAAVQVAPALLHAAHGHAADTPWAAPGVRLVELLAPGATGAGGATLGGGAAIVGLALVGRSRWLVVPALLLLAALARPPLATLAWAWLAALAGVAFGALSREPPTRATWGRAATVLGGLAVAVAALVVLRYPLARAVDRAGLDGPALLLHAQERGLIALAAVAVVLGLTLVAARRGAAPLAALAALAALVEVAVAGRAAVPQRPRAAATGALTAALAQAAPTRVFRNAARGATLDDALAHAAAASAAPAGVAAVPGTDPARLALEDRLPAATASVASRLLDRYAVPHAIVPATVVTAAGVTVLARHDDQALIATAARRPPAFWVSRWRHVDDAAALAAFTPPPGQAAEPLGTVLLAGAGDAGGDDLAQPRPCDVRRPDSATVRLACAVTAAGYAVVLDAWAPGWTATVDGRAVPVERADLIARGVRVGPGARVIVLRYAPPGLALGAAISALALLNVGLLLVLTRRRAAPAA